MPSPIGHAIAGVAIAWSTEALHPDSCAKHGPTLALACAAAAMAPDLDLLLPFQHRTATHSVLTLAAGTILAIAVTGKVRPPGRLIVVACAAAYASHLLLDWLAEDSVAPRGIQLLWPASREWFISNADLFRGTARRAVFTAASMRTNALAILQETAILGPLAAVAWLVRVKALARFATKVARGDHAPQ